jgi:hypothetical protein
MLNKFTLISIPFFKEVNMKKIVNKFALIFRMDITTKESEPTTALIQWEGWINDLAAKNKLSDWGNKLSREGRVIKPNNVITDPTPIIMPSMVRKDRILLPKILCHASLNACIILILTPAFCIH